MPLRLDYTVGDSHKRIKGGRSAQLITQRKEYCIYSLKDKLPRALERELNKRDEAERKEEEKREKLLQARRDRKNRRKISSIDVSKFLSKNSFFKEENIDNNKNFHNFKDEEEPYTPYNSDCDASS